MLPGGWSCSRHSAANRTVARPSLRIRSSTARSPAGACASRRFLDIWRDSGGSRDRSEGVLLHLPPTLVVGDVPERPSDADVGLAKRLLLEELFGDFPFSGDADRAHALGALLCPFVREVIDSPLPLHVVDAPTPGTGKGLLAQAIVLISTVAYPRVSSRRRTTTKSFGRPLPPSCSRERRPS